MNTPFVPCWHHPGDLISWDLHNANKGQASSVLDHGLVSAALMNTPFVQCWHHPGDLISWDLHNANKGQASSVLDHGLLSEAHVGFHVHLWAAG